MHEYLRSYVELVGKKKIVSDEELTLENIKQKLKKFQYLLYDEGSETNGITPKSEPRTIFINLFRLYNKRSSSLTKLYILVVLLH